MAKKNADESAFLIERSISGSAFDFKFTDKNSFLGVFRTRGNALLFGSRSTEAGRQIHLQGGGPGNALHTAFKIYPTAPWAQ